MDTESAQRRVEAVAQRYARSRPGLVVAAFGPAAGEGLAAVGHRRLPDGPPPTSSTLFEIGSISKVFTSLLLAIAVTQGEVSLDAPVRELLSAGTRVPQRRGREITLLDLATHRSGLPRSPVPVLQEIAIVARGRGNPYADLDPARLLEALGRTRLRRTPGTNRLAYSNFGVGVLGVALVRAAGGSTYGELVQARICGPLGLADTVPLEQVIGNEDGEARLAYGHNWRCRPVAHWTLSGLAGAGALLSTADDLLAFLRAQLRPEDTPLGEAIALTQQRRGGGRRFGIGLGWLQTPTKAGTLLWHNGGTGGFRSFAGIVPAAGTGVVVLANSTRSVDRAALELLEGLR